MEVERPQRVTVERLAPEYAQQLLQGDTWTPGLQLQQPTQFTTSHPGTSQEAAASRYDVCMA